MKKLFTLIALMVCALGANAVEKVDAEVIFANESSIHLFGWGGQGTERLSLQDGCLYYHNEAATENAWDVQFFPIGGVDVEVGVTYTLKLKIKGSVAGPFWNISFAGVDKYSIFEVPTEWTELEFQYEATGTSGDALFQCGSYVGDWWIEYIKITHEEREQRPVEWVNIVENGDASGEYGDVPCAYSKEWGYNLDEDGAPQPHPALIEDGMFVCHAKTVDPVIVFDQDTELWGQQYKAGDPMPDNTWQNQFWINFPRAMKADEQVKISFRYKASKAVRVTTQDHVEPGNYLGGGKLGDVNFTTDWQTFDKTFSAAAGVQSIAFNFGEDNHYLEDIDFYFDDISVSLMKLDEGFFVASTNTETGMVDYDFDNAIEFTYNEEEEQYFATVGTVGDPDSWVNEIMISTVRGNDKAFKAATVKVTEGIIDDADSWNNYVEASNAKIKLPASGVWSLIIWPEYEMISFAKLEGEEAHEPIVIVENPTEVVVHGLERELTDTEQPANEEAGIEAGTGRAWDNQFFLVANRTLSTGEVTVIKFKYKSSIPAKTTTQCHGTPGNYLHWGAIGDVTFAEEWQEFETTYTVPSEANGMQSIAFNMAEIKEACDYYIKDIIWCTEDCLETLIDMEGPNNFYVKEGAGTTPHIFGTNPEDAVTSIVGSKPALTPAYNLAGQRVTKSYKGIVIRNGKKVVVK